MSLILDPYFMELADRAKEAWGIDSQIDMMIEECSELITVLIKRNRKVNGVTSQAIINELVDVEIMLGQMKNIFYIPDSKIWRAFHENKLERLRQRLKASE